MKNKFNIPVVKDISIFNVQLNCIDHYNTIDGSINYSRTLNRYNKWGIFISKNNNVHE